MRTPIDQLKREDAEKARDWFLFCEAVGIQADTHEVVAAKINHLRDEMVEALEAASGLLMALTGPDDAYAQAIIKCVEDAIKKAAKP